MTDFYQSPAFPPSRIQLDAGASPTHTERVGRGGVGRGVAGRGWPCVSRPRDKQKLLPFRFHRDAYGAVLVLVLVLGLPLPGPALPGPAGLLKARAQFLPFLRPLFPPPPP